MNYITHSRPWVLGFSIVELMVAMTIGLVILLATTAIFVQSKQSHTTQDSLARLQENSRFAMQFIMRDLRMAGYFGCGDDISTVTNVVSGATAGGAFDTTSPIQGSESKSNWYPLNATPVPPRAEMWAGTDAVSLRYLEMENVAGVTPPFASNAAAAIQVTPGNTLQPGDIVMVSDCSTSAMFQITGATDIATSGNVLHVDTGATPGNTTANLGGKIYQNDAQIAKYYYASYYIAEGTSSGQPALFRDTLVVNAATSTASVARQELVEGIENLQILYGEDTSGDRVPDQYVKADAVANWRNVVAVRIGILARSLAQTDGDSKEHGRDLDTNTYDVDGDGSFDYWDLDGDGTVDTTPPNDRYQRRVFRTTVLMRNLQ